MKNGTFNLLRRDTVNQLSDALTDMRVAFGDAFVLLAQTDPMHDAVDLNDLATTLHQISYNVNELIEMLGKLDLNEEETECDTADGLHY